MARGLVVTGIVSRVPLALGRCLGALAARWWWQVVAEPQGQSGLWYCGPCRMVRFASQASGLLHVPYRMYGSLVRTSTTLRCMTAGLCCTS